MPSDDLTSLALPLLMLGLGGLFAVLGVRNLRRVSRLRSAGTRVPGRVTGRSSRASGASGSSRTTAARFEFRTMEGEVITVQQKISTTFNRLHPGMEVTVAYDPADPREAEVIESKSQIGGAVMFAAIGGVFFVVGLVMTSSRFLG